MVHGTNLNFEVKLKTDCENVKSIRDWLISLKNQDPIIIEDFETPSERLVQLHLHTFFGLCKHKRFSFYLWSVIVTWLIVVACHTKRQTLM